MDRRRGLCMASRRSRSWEEGDTKQVATVTDSFAQSTTASPPLPLPWPGPGKGSQFRLVPLPSPGVGAAHPDACFSSGAWGPMGTQGGGPRR